MFILLWMYLGGIICSLLALVGLAIVNHYRIRKMIATIILSLVWPIAYFANVIIIIRDAIRRNKTEY